LARTIGKAFCPIESEGQTNSSPPQDKTTSLTAAKLGLADLKKTERVFPRASEAVAEGKMTFGDCLEVFKTRMDDMDNPLGGPVPMIPWITAGHLNQYEFFAESRRGLFDPSPHQRIVHTNPRSIHWLRSVKGVD
jgi:hypothetical protein